MCVFMCVCEVTRRRQSLQCVMYWLDSQQRIYTNLPSCFFLSLSLYVFHFVLLSLQPAYFFYSFEFSGSCVLTHCHTLTLDTHTVSNTIFTLSGLRQGVHLKTQTLTSASYSHQIALALRVKGPVCFCLQPVN